MLHPLPQKTSDLISVAAFVGVAIVTVLAGQEGQPNSHSDDGYFDYDSLVKGNDAKVTTDVPTHVKRLLHKERRRKDSVRFLAMKKPMYDNIEMYAPNGELLCTIATKKANWYVRKELANWMVESKSIQLFFEPKAKSPSPNVYNQSHKKNICVVCGDSNKFMRHYVVPYCYRTLFPAKYKTHMPHDIVILCPDCHLYCEQSTQRRQKALEASLRKNPETARPSFPDKHLYNIRSAALALSNHRSKLPPPKIEVYEGLVREHYGLGASDPLPDDLLGAATTIEITVPNPNYIPGPEIVVSQLANTAESLEEFILGWREHFLETMQPRFLQKGWDIDSAVHSGV